MSSELTAAQFADFFAAVHGSGGAARGPSPFPWQETLAGEIAATGRWPALLDLPTGAGKTAAIDIAVFMMALREDAPRRVVFVIDRKVVVQQAAERARALAAALRTSADPVVAAVAEKLRGLSARPGGQNSGPLQWAELRGGIVRDESWALRPDVPAVLVSTVDQVGSRLLFRGYGISRGMRPVHAGLLAADALFLLDEVHLARPFAETLDVIASRYRPPAEAGLPDRWQVVQLSATPGAASPGRTVYRLSDRDRDPEVAPVLARRLAARKEATKILVPGRSRDGQRAALAEEAARQAHAFITNGQAMVVGVVLNRVAAARAAYDQLDSPDFERALITGRMRPLDRDDLLRDLTDRIRTGRDRGPADRPLALVGTQSVEAGADYDFDALVTECASFDSLRQRFGRVDRDGKLSADDRPSRSVILAMPGQVSTAAPADPVYGHALARTWQWLPESAGFDLADLAPDARALKELVVPKQQAPVLLASHLDRWVQTSPYPDADPDVGLWLHGPGQRQADASLIWRADLTEDLLTAGDDGRELAISLVTACRPGSAEAMTVPVQAVRAWLAGLAGARPESVPVADVEGADLSEPDSGRPGRQPVRPALRWSGDDSAVVGSTSDIWPGCTLIVPASYGGVHDFNWAPGSPEPVADLAHRVQAGQQRAVLRLHPKVLGDDADRLPPLPWPADVDAAEDADDGDVVSEWLVQADAVLAGDGLTGRIVRSLRADRRRRVTRVGVGPAAGPDEVMFVVSSLRRDPALSATEALASDAVDTEPGTSPFTGTLVPLDDHLGHVEAWAGALATACGLSGRLSASLALAGQLHDVGKADPRFQDMLRQDRVTDGTLLAKSGLPAASRAARERARRNAGYPSGARHELLSVALVQDDPQIAADCDWELVLYLIASHHGYCRPFAPPASDPRPVTARIAHRGRQWEHSTETGLARLDSGVPDRFWLLVRRYGWFGLAWLESILRLADHRASSEEQAPAEKARAAVTATSDASAASARTEARA